MSWFAVVLTIVVTVGVVVLILVFERKRARQIEHDLREPVAPAAVDDHDR